MKTGIKGSKSVTVDKSNTAAAVGSGTLDVFATPSMIALMEATASESVQELIEDGLTTVGTSVDIKHLSATPVGCTVRCESTLVEIDRKRLVFELNVYDEFGIVGSGRHERFIVQSNKFMEKANQKIN